MSVKWSSAQLPADHMAHTLEVFNTHVAAGLTQGTPAVLKTEPYTSIFRSLNTTTRGQESYYIMEEAGDSLKERDRQTESCLSSLGSGVRAVWSGV